MHLSIRTKLLLLFAGLAVLPMALVGVASYYQAVRAVELVVERRGLEAARRGAEEAGRLVGARRSEIALLARSRDALDVLVAYAAADAPALLDLRPRLDAAFRQFFTGPRELFAQVQYVTLGGMTAYRFPEIAALPTPTQPDVGRDRADHDVRGLDPRGGTVLVNAFSPEFGPLLRFVRPVVAPETREAVGFVFADLSVAAIVDATPFGDASGAVESAVLIDREHDRVVHHPNAPLIGLAVAGAIPGFGPAYAAMDRGTTPGVLRYEHAAETWLVSHVDAPELAWTFAVFTRPSHYTAEPRRAAARNLGITLAAVLAAMLLMTVLIGRIAGSIRKVTEGAEALADDVFAEPEIVVDAGDETGLLANAFNRMAASLRATLVDLRNLTLELEDRVTARTAELAEANKQLEDQNRELEVERAVERLRTRVAAMQASDELGRIAGAVKDELRGLDVSCEEVGINLVDDDGATMQAYSTEADAFDDRGGWRYNEDVEALYPYFTHWRDRATWHRFGAKCLMAEVGQAFLRRGDATAEGVQQALAAYPDEGRTIVDAPFEHGTLAMNHTGDEPFSDGDIALFERFTEVFAVAYRRHLDLEAAEARARRAELERAIERVRSEAMAMRTSTDLRRVVAVMWREVQRLGIEAPGLSFQFIDEERDRYGHYYCYANPRRFGADLCSDKLLEIDADTVAFGHEGSGIETMTGWLDGTFGDRWRAGEAWTFTQSEHEHSVRQFLAETGLERLPEELCDHWAGDWQVTNVPFTYGTVGYREREFVEAHVAIVRELTEALSVGYLRFLDFQRLEEQNRELEVERAVERLRTRVAAMQASDELDQIAAALKSELGGLEVPCEAVGINLVEADGRTMRPYASDASSSDGWHEDESIEALYPYFTHWRNRATWHRFWPKEVFAGVGQAYLRRGDAVPESVQQALAAYPDAGRTIVDAPFEHGTLAMNHPGNEPFSDGDIALFERFTEVFALGYRRHLDLVAAEARARQADLDRARQRVRGEVMAMQSADDITDVVEVLRDELRGLGVDCEQIGINIVDEAAGSIQTSWSSDAETETPAAPSTEAGQQLGWTRLIEHWHRGEVWNRPRRDSEDDPALSGWVVDVPFDQGTLAMNRGQSDPESSAFTDEEIDLLAGFAEVVSLGYTRFLDFERLEAQVIRLEEAHRALERANAEVEKANRLKSDFLARMSHDLRTPMNAIIGYTRILLRRAKEALEPRQYRNLENIDTSAEHLLSLINDILDLSRIEAGRVEVHIRDVDLAELVDQCVTSVRPLLKSGVELQLEMDNVGSVATDGDRVQRVLMNLLGNAAKFTDAGHVAVRVGHVDGQLELCVADTGAGIPADDLPYIFEEFRQVENAPGASEGSGLGLAIARKSVEMLGGSIGVESELGAGTTFTVRLPAS